ncbi:Hypothetical predicted protein [Cloeon dipterum]|uniref:PDZ domain-containing protein n=1 Tax=Cloeon dipterum TaxID=197152 RepID=A0A8S1CW32_9INSE|nr:Hypothetical predicted protein [Cloeon dipterum]
MSASTAAPGRQVVLRGGSPWGFRMHGGADTTQPLRISRVNPGSKAFDESVREGEVITSINGQPTIGLPNCEAHALIKAAGDTLELTLSQDPSKRRPHKPATPPQPEHNTEKQTSETGEVKESKEYASEISLATQKTASTNKTKSQPPASHESPKSSSHRVGGRQKRSRRLRARKLALQLDSLLHTPDAGLLPEPRWEHVDEQIAPLPLAVHAYPLVYAEAIVASDASDQLVRQFQVHVATKAKMQAKLRKAETFPPSLRRLDVIREDEEAAHSIYEDVDLRGTQESLLSSDGEMVPSDADEATLEFEKIMNLEEQNYEAYHSSSSDVDGDFGRCRSEDYEPVLVREGRLLVQRVRVQQCPGEEFEQICDAEELLDGRNIEAEEVCRQNSELIESPEPEEIADNKENIEPRTKKSEDSKVVLEIAKLNFLKTPFEDEILSKTEIITLDSPRSSGKIPRALAAQLEENLEMLEREIEAENEQLRDVAARSAEIVDKFSAKLDEMNELINVSGSPVIMEQINEFAEQLIAAEDKSLFETNKDKLVSFIREASGMEAVRRPAKVQDESNLLRFLEQEPRAGDQEEQTLTSLEEVTRRLTEVLQNSLQNSPSPPPPAEANFDSSDNEAGKSGLSRTPVSLARSRSASFDSNASQGTTIYVGSPCSSACSSGWTAGGGVVPSLRTLCVSAVGRLARGRELMLAWGLASAADLKISRPNLARRPVPPPPAPRWFPTGLGAIAVGLSPAQQRAEPQLTRERAALLLDLHCKFAQRRAYHEQRPLPAAPAAPAASADAMGVDEASPDAEKMLQDWLQDELSIDESHTQSVMTTARKFEVDRYHISKQRDIAVEIQGQRQFRMLRQQMEQLEEERRQQEQLLDDEQQQMAPPVGADSPIAEQDPLQRLAQLESHVTAAASMAAQEQAADGHHGPGNNNNATSTPPGKMPSAVPSPSFKAKAPSPGVWSPKTSRAHPPPPQPQQLNSLPSPTSSNNDEPPPPPVWTPKASPTLERKEFRPVRFEASTPPPRPPPCTQEVPPPFDPVATATISNFLDRKLTLDIPKLPRAQNPTVTLLQRAREGQLPKGATYLERTTMSASDQTQQQKETQAQQESASNFNPNDILYTVKREEEKEANKKVVQLAPIVYDGIGPTTKDGIPIVMRSNIKEENYGKWYKRMYDSLHKAGKDDDSITIRYRPSSNSRRGHGGYASEPEPSGDYDSDVAGGISSKYATLDRRRIKNKEADFTSTTMPRSRGMAPSIKYACEVYKNQPGRIEDYEPGRSSISEKEAKLQSGMQASAQSKKLHASSFSHAAESQSTAKKQHMANALKDVSASDTQLVFKKRTESEALSPVEQKQVYKTIQSGGEVPLSGLRKLAPEKPKDGIEYFPVSPTLTRIRVHKPSFCSFKRTARLAAPMPPLRRSSRHNPSLRLWSTLPAPPTRVGLLRERLLAKPSRIPVGTTTRSTTVLLGRREPVRLSVTVSPRGRQLLNTNETAPVRRVSASAARHADCVAKKKVALKAAPAPSSLAKPKSKEEPAKKPAPRRKMGVASKKPSCKPKEEARVLEKARKFSHLARTARPSAESSAQLFLTQRRAVSQSPFRVYDALFHCSAPCLAPRQQRSRSAPPAVLEPGNRRPLTPLTPQARADYVEYLLELRHKLPPGRRFKELAHLFSSLERIANLQKLTASCSDVRKAVAKQPKLANFERWWCERTLYKADKELRQLYDDLRQAQRDSVFAGRVPGALPTWRPDSGLRCKEVSVEDLRNKYLSIASAEGTTALQLAKLDELQTQKDNYKPLWRASSVQNLAEQMCSGEKRRSRSVGGGARASSLTGQQVATLKSRLSDILKTPPPTTTKFEVCVGADDKAKQKSLHVRRNSLVSREQLYSPAARRREAKRSASMKADSVAALPSAAAGLSESDKRRISLSLSQEILARVGNKKMKKNEAKTTAEPSREKPSGKKAGVPPPPPPEQSPAVSPRTCYSLDGSAKKEDDEQFVLVLAPAGDAAANKAVEQWAGAGAGAGGRASTTSSDASNRTVVSRSCTDLKDFFGERAATPTSMVRARSTSPVVRSLTERFERRRTPSPIAPRKFKDRFVSRVNVISKTASLQVKIPNAFSALGTLA